MLTFLIFVYPLSFHIWKVGHMSSRFRGCAAPLSVDLAKYMYYSSSCLFLLRTFAAFYKLIFTSHISRAPKLQHP